MIDPLIAKEKSCEFTADHSINMQSQLCSVIKRLYLSKSQFSPVKITEDLVFSILNYFTLNCHVKDC